MLELVKDYLRITWDDEDSNIVKLIERAKAEIQRIAGVELDFDNPGQPQVLLLDWCRYSRNNSLEYFQENFRYELLQLRLEEGVKDYAKSR